MYDIHMRRCCYQRIFCGRPAKDKFPGQTTNIVVEGKIENPHPIPEIVTGLFVDCRVRPKYTPVVILEPPGLWSPKVKIQLADVFVGRFQNPSISFLSSAVAVLCRYMQMIVHEVKRN